MVRSNATSAAVCSAVAVIALAGAYMSFDVATAPSARAQTAAVCDDIDGGLLNEALTAPSGSSPPQMVTTEAVALLSGESISFSVSVELPFFAVIASVTQSAGPGATSTIIPDTTLTASGASGGFVAPADGVFAFTYMIAPEGSPDVPNTITFTAAAQCAPPPTTPDPDPDPDPEPDPEPDPDPVVEPDPVTTTTRRFLGRRGDFLLADEPDRARMIRRLPSVLWEGESGDDAAYAAPGQLFARVDETGVEADFATSLSAIASTIGEDQGVRRFDFWVEGHFQTFDAAADTEGDFGVVYFGADYLVNPNVLIGALGQIDFGDESSDLLDVSVEGDGWMAGPYATFRLAPTLFFDIRAAGGRSDNDLVLGGEAFSFQTTRFLARGNLTGSYAVDDWRLTPSASVAYFGSFVEDGDASVEGESVTVGRLTFGPEIARRIAITEDLTLEPHASFEGIWDFDREDTFEINGFTVDETTLRGRVEGGVLLESDSGVNFRGVVTYDGIGAAEFDALGAELWINIPLR